MLERLDEIDWYSLGHAYGDASDVPDMIRGLASKDDAEREQAWNELIGSVRHQGDVYDTTPVVVPFLIEILSDPSLPDKANFLMCFCYYSVDYADWSYSNEEEEMAGGEYTQQTRQSIEEGMPIYLSLLDDPDSEIRSWAARVLTLCFSQHEKVSETLRHRLHEEPDASVRMVWVLQLGVLNRSEDVSFLTEVSARDDDLLVRLSAALMCIYIDVDETPESVFQLIEECAKSSSHLFDQFPEHEWIVNRAVYALKKREEFARNILLQLLKSPSPAVRTDALGNLGIVCSQTPEIIQAVVNLLSDPVANVRSSAAYYLGDLGDSEIHGAKWSGNHEVLVTLELHLAKLAPIAIAGLVESVQKEQDDVVLDAMCRAIKGLAMWAELAIPVLQKFSPNEWEAEQALEVIEAFQRNDTSEIFELAMSADDKISWMAGRLLMKIARNNPQEVIPLLVEHLDAWPNAVKKSAGLLGELGACARSALPALRKALQHSNDYVRKVATKSLQTIAPELPPVQKIPSEEEIRLRLGEDISKELPELINTLLDDSYTAAQHDALWKIGQMGTEAESAIPFVREAMEKKWLYYDAAGALSRLDPESIRPMMSDLLRKFESRWKDEEYDLRYLTFLAYLGPELQPDAIQFLILCLPESGEKPSKASIMIPHAVAYLHTAEPEVLLPLLIRILETNWEKERGMFNSIDPVLKFLKTKGDIYRKATPAVLSKLDPAEQDPLILKTLSRIGTWTTVVPHLKSFLTGEGQMRTWAEKCISTLGESAAKEDLPALQESLDHQSEVVRQSAITALKRLTED